MNNHLKKIKAKFHEDENVKVLSSPVCNYYFDKNTGYMATWGKTKDDDPEYSPFGPFIADIEVTTICRGPAGVICPWCYKSNTAKGENMSFDTFKEIIDKMPRVLTQVALGADAQCESNPEIWDMMKYCREKGVIPNITVADISNKVADKLVEHCGAVAVSRYANKSLCYNSIQKLVSRGLKQTNMHLMIHADNFDNVVETINDYHTDERLKGMNAIVFLSLKQKGRGEKFKPLPQEKFTEIVELCMNNGVPFGFDSCSAGKYIEAVKNHPNAEQLIIHAEPCESTRCSIYFNEKGEYYPCSFCEDMFKPIHISEVDSVMDLWHREEVQYFRKRLLDNKDINGATRCPVFNV